MHTKSGKQHWLYHHRIGYCLVWHKMESWAMFQSPKVSNKVRQWLVGQGCPVSRLMNPVKWDLNSAIGGLNGVRSESWFTHVPQKSREMKWNCIHNYLENCKYTVTYADAKIANDKAPATIAKTVFIHAEDRKLGASILIPTIPKDMNSIFTF